MNKQIKIIFTALLLQCLVACGGDGKSSEPTPNVNNAPSLSVEFTEAVVGETFSSAISTFDADGDALTLRIENQPQWLILDVTNKRLSGTPQTGDEGIFSEILLTVSDGAVSTELLFDITVMAAEDPINQPPTIELVITSMKAGQYYEFILQVFDADGDKLTLSLANAPAWLFIDNEQNLLYGTAPAVDEGLIENINLTVSDGKDTAQVNFDIEVINPMPLPAMLSCE